MRGGSLGLALGLGLMGCASLTPRIPPPPEAARYLADPLSLHEELKSRRRGLKDLKAWAQVEVDSPRERYSGRAVLLLKAEESLRIEPLSFFGQPVLYIISHNQSLTVYSPQEGKYLQGRATPENIFLWLGVPVEPGEIVSLLWGDLPKLLTSESLRIAYEERTGAYRLESVAPGGPFGRWWVDARTLHPLRAEGLGPGGKTHLAVQYDDYREVEGIPLPGRVRIQVPSSHRAFGVTYENLRVNEGIPDLVFHLPIPEGAEVVSIDRNSPHVP